MSESSLVIGLAATFAGITALLVVLALALPSPFLVVVALPFALVAALMWYHGTGRFEARVRRQAARSRARGRRSRRATRERGRRVGPRGATTDGGGSGSTTAPPPADDGPTATEAYRRLDLSPGADEDAIRQAYREKVKVAHPDRGGDEEEFKRVTAAYERLTGD